MPDAPFPRAAWILRPGGRHQHHLRGLATGLARCAFAGRQFGHTQNAVPRGLRLVGDDGDLLASKSVQQGGLAGIGLTEDGYDSAF